MNNLNIVIPMAGLSSRFKDAGYILPKYMLYVNGKSLLELSLLSFSNHFHTAKFILIYRNVFDSNRFIKESLCKLGIIDFELVELEENTKGQAETVFLGITAGKLHPDWPMLIFNIDTIRRNFVFPEDMANCDGYLETFTGIGENWSYARTDDMNSNKVIETAEKKRISDNCSTGLYFFKSIDIFLESYSQREEHKGELYIAPLYNNLIKLNRDIRLVRIFSDDVVFSGTPIEYMNLVKANC